MKGIRDGRVAVAALLWMVMVPAAVVFGWTEMAEPAFAVEESVGQSDMTGTGKICVIVEPSGHGAVNGSDEAFEEKVAIGGDLVLKLQADDGYVIGKVLVNGASLDASDLMGLQGAESGELKLEDLDEEVNLRIGFMTKEDYAAFQDKAEETIDEVIDEMEEKLKITDPQTPEGSAEKAPDPIVSKEDEGAADGETVRVGDANDGKAGSDDGDDEVDAEDANDDDAEDADGDDDDGSGDDETDAGDDDESGDEEADAGDDDEPDDEDADDVDDESSDDDADDEDADGDDDDESGDADDEDADDEDMDDDDESGGDDDDDDEMTDDDDGSSADDEDADDDDAAASGDDEDNDDDEHSADGTGAGGTNDKNDETSADDADNVDDADDEKKAGDGKNETGENDDKNTSPIDDDADGARAGGASDETGSGGSGNKNDAVEVDDSLEEDDDELLEDDAADAAADLDMTETTVQAGAGTSDSLGSSGSSGSPKTGDAIPLKDLLLAAAGMTLSGLALAGTSGAHFFRRRRNQ